MMDEVPVQAEKGAKGKVFVPPGYIDWDEHVLAWEAYAKIYRGQDAETIAKRGGFGWNELVKFLTYAPKTWRPRDPNLAEEYEPPAGRVGL